MKNYSVKLEYHCSLLVRIEAESAEEALAAALEQVEASDLVNNATLADSRVRLLPEKTS